MRDQSLPSARLGFVPVLLLAAAHALLFVLSFPAFSLWVFAFVAPVVLALVCVLARRRRDLVAAVALTQLLAWGFLHWWVLGVTVPGFFALVIYLTLWSVLEASLLRMLVRGSIQLPLPIALPLVLLGIDFLRAYVVFDGYPWYLRAQPLIDAPGFAVLGPLGGIWLAGFPALAIAGVVAFFICRWWGRSLNPYFIVAAIGSVIGLCVSVLIVNLPIVRGTATEQQGPEYTVLLIQTNLPTDNKIGWTYERQLVDIPEFIEQTHRALEEARAEGVEVDLIVWPETMLPSIGFELGDEFSDAIERAVGAFGVPMLVGSPSYHGISQGPTGEVTWEAHYNSAYLVNDDGPPYARVDKVFLTPFGETMPYISSWPWLEEQLLAIGAAGMSFDLDEGALITRLVLPKENDQEDALRLAVPICFEDTMAPVVRRMVWEDGARVADVLVNISNDGWFGGDDAGREMHVLCARWRAVENQMWVLRAVNTGDSVAIAPDGTVTDRIPSGPQTAGALLTRVRAPGPVSLFYASIGDALGVLLALVLGVLVVTEWWYTRRQRSRRLTADAPE